jgi:hypothetical protein
MLSKKQAKKIAQLVSSIVVYGGMVSRYTMETDKTAEEIRQVMGWHDDAASELNQILGQDPAVVLYRDM